YGFNKSHSTGYAIVAYQTAYLKTYFPVHYMAALLTYESVSTDKVVEYIDECKRVMRPNGQRGIEVKPPDVNLSDIAFTVVYDDDEPHDAAHGHIRFGLSAVKGVGEKAIRAILEQREKEGPFKSLYDFCERVPLGAVNRATIEALIKCGAFDEVHDIENRAAMMAALDTAISAGQRAAADREAGQLNFFDALSSAGSEERSDEGPDPAPDIQLPTVEPWTTQEQLRVEKEVLGFYVSSHPLDEHRDALHRFSTCDVSQAKQLAADVPVVIGGMLTRVRPTMVKRGRSAGSKMAMLTIDDGRNTMEGVTFSDVYAQCYHHLETDRVVFLKGKIDRRREEPGIVVDQVVPIEQAPESLTETVKIVVQDPKPGRDGTAFNGEFARLRELLRQAASRANGKSADVMLQLHQDGKCVRLRLNGLRVGVDRELPTSINHLLNSHEAGNAWCELVGPPKINPDHVSGDMIHRDDAPEPEKLTFSMQDDGGESIDRY
ncbi:MAG: OB-fold nucleic acid binding domain-containing protein, partial [Phycisphaeraceae bacterium]